MYSLKDIIKANDFYDKTKNELNKLYEKTCKINDDLDLNEVNIKLNYSEAKELYEKISYRINNKEKASEFEKILSEKKSKEYPLINDVHYYSEINNANFLSKEEKIVLDLTVKLAYKNARETRKINKMDTEIIDFLLANSIIEKQYIFHCNCNSDECYDKVISEERFNKLKDYWLKDKEGIATEEDEKETNFGCFDTGCSNEGNVEICSLEDFNKHLRRIEYKVIKTPDTSLDNI